MFFFFNDTATTEIYTLSLHDALPISRQDHSSYSNSKQEPFFTYRRIVEFRYRLRTVGFKLGDRKSTRLNSSHSQISYAAFFLKKKKRKHATIALPAVYHMAPFSSPSH